MAPTQGNLDEHGLRRRYTARCLWRLSGADSHSYRYAGATADRHCDGGATYPNGDAAGANSNLAAHRG